ncbi:SRPBCC family protein [Paenibacillus aquistagni]|uniref:SRPBCC family protein n=1 Tax=Paenibacillus aquistagni TaxID=1852522 RepID=UPI00145AB6F7|nr:SRPBCC family protein [Paenibacillus aquistagni]NMM53871.1 SRPBCC family protein [Paenibacillus aquistagni]
MEQPLAKITALPQGFQARFERYYNQQPAELWDMLTNNEKLSLWFNELSVQELKIGGSIFFDMQDGTHEKMEILDCIPGQVLEYAWGSDSVRFELAEVAGGSKLVLVEKLHEITAHTPKDLAGWHVCLDAIKCILEHRQLESRMDIWKVKYEQYVQLLEPYLPEPM